MRWDDSTTTLSLDNATSYENLQEQFSEDGVWRLK